ncbi:hypothetical protein KAFR_0H00360 [Kazachstania africana CBS 2517]|uniref:Nucleoporin Nup133/Nup155-like N-terminal domain-containing protein n=1 Tax=Kazachstania africana (strain ATCC 22294 / BCRC 22015 / CBS 2517 / CECT 1963 / NBRC 1671 / NRRL Y-8276) TaxID=1071382 RepID=H2AYN9_KAZAF|nr:hypothetical protein KAFR_0H00360 [Kazachstania africana CBS 2517]CCF59445.1 hypothetical protein KAFR_0H00360 [Kazachstania africana CBS 2517]
MGSNQPLFQLRKELESPSPNVYVDNDDTVNYAAMVDSTMDTTMDSFKSFTQNDQVKIFTENEKYTVERLATALPNNVTTSQLLSGSVDTTSKKALINDLNNLYVWDYSTEQTSTNFGAQYRVPLHSDHGELDALPLCLVTWPSTMEDITDSSSFSNCGIVIIEKNSGLITYFEDIDSINNLSSQISRNLAHTLDLKLDDSDGYVTHASNCEPSGIVVATSHGRVLFVTIRDSIGSPSVQLKQQLIKASKKFLFGFRLGSSKLSSHNVVSLKNGPIVGKGERLLYITTLSGEFQAWQLSVSSNSFKRISTNVSGQIVDSLKDLYPFAYGSLKILDAHPLFHSNPNVHLFLSSINNNDETYYILSTIIFDERTNNFTIFSTYRLNTTVTPLLKDDPLPKLFIPNALHETSSPVTSVFVLFKHFVILTQVSSKLDSNYTLRRKWEDIISFREDVDIIGSGYDTDSLYLMNKGLGGIMKITIKPTNNDINELQQTPGFIKSHVDQAIYFATSSSNNPVEFNLSEDIFLENGAIESDLILSADEIFNSTGRYIPPTTNNLQQHLNLRIGFFKNLLKFTELNFNYKVSPKVKLALVEKFEIMNCCLRLLQFVSRSDEFSSKLNNIWALVLKKRGRTVDEIVLNRLSEFPNLFSAFLTDINVASESVNFKSSLIDLLASCIYECVLEDGEQTLRHSSLRLDPLEIDETKLPWFISPENLTVLNKIFFDYKFSLDKEKISITTNEKEQFLTLLKILYYFFNQTKIWVSQSGFLPNSKENDQFSKAIESMDKLYEENHIDWNRVLCELNYEEQSLQITEFYNDLKALIETLELIPNNEKLYLQFFDKFQYPFSSTLFEYYIKNNKLHDLFYRFPSQHDQLIDFFNNNYPKYSQFSWIQDILDDDYKKASNTLANIDFLGESITKNQLSLNIAKLSGLVEETNVDNDELANIQRKLDILDGEFDLYQKVKHADISLNDRYKNTQFEIIYNKQVEELKQEKTIPFVEVIDLYSLLSDSESFVYALKLLAFNSDNLEYELKQILISMVWRRCVLCDMDRLQEDIRNSILYQVIEKFFEQKLYFANFPLPSVSLITDTSTLSREYLKHVYSNVLNEQEINNVTELISASIERLTADSSELQKRLHSALSLANEVTGSHCVINYEINTMEFK